MRHRRHASSGLCLLPNAAGFICGLLAFATWLIISDVAGADDKPKAAAAPASGKPNQAAFDPGVLIGQVVSADGKPVADAKVLLRGKTQRGAKTDGEGRFRFEYLQPGHLSIQATKGNLISPREEIDGLRVPGFKTGKFAPIKLTVSPGQEIKVLVTSAADGKPLAGVEVRFWFLKWNELKTAKDGTATLGGLVPGSYQVDAHLPGYAGASRDVEVSAANAVTRVELSLGPGGIVRGVVTDEQGQAVDGARVSCVDQEHHRQVSGSANKTDVQGTFRCDSIPLSTAIELAIDKDDYLPYQQPVALVPDRREFELKVKLRRRPRGGSIEGVVRDEHGKPMAGASVENHGNRSDQRRKTTTDRGGHYVLDDLLESWQGYDVIVRAAGRAPLTETVKPGSKDKPAHVDFTLEAGHFIHGRIVGENGKPIGGVYVALANDMWQLAISKQSDEMGRFEMDSLPAQARFQISKQGYSSLFNVPLRLDAAGQATVMLQPMGVIRGRVVDPQSKKPLEHFQVWFNFARVRQSGMQWTYSGNLIYPGKRIDTKDGTFTVDDLMNGLPVEVGIAADGYWRTIVPLVVAKPADEAKQVEIALARIDPSKLVPISGRMLDHAGHGVPGANVRLIVTASPSGPNDYNFNWYMVKNGQLAGSADCDQFLQAVSDSEGRFEFKNVLPDKHWKLAYWGVHVPQGRLTETGRTKAGEAKSVTVKLPQPARIVVTIDRVKFPEASQFNAQLKGTWWQISQVTINAGQTKFEIEDLAPGKYSVAIQGKPVAVKSPQGTYYTVPTIGTQTIQLNAGDNKDVRF